MIQLAYDVLDTKGNAVSSCRRFHRTLFDEATIISLFEREREREATKKRRGRPRVPKIGKSIIPFCTDRNILLTNQNERDTRPMVRRSVAQFIPKMLQGTALPNWNKKKWILIGSAMNVNEPRVCVLLINLSACNSSDWSIVVEQPSADWWRHGIPVEKWGKREIRKAHDQRRHETKLHETIILLSARSSSSQRLFNR